MSYAAKVDVPCLLYMRSAHDENERNGSMIATSLDQMIALRMLQNISAK